MWQTPYKSIFWHPNRFILVVYLKTDRDSYNLLQVISFPNNNTTMHANNASYIVKNERKKCYNIGDVAGDIIRQAYK